MNVEKKRNDKGIMQNRDKRIELKANISDQ